MRTGQVVLPGGRSAVPAVPSRHVSRPRLDALLADAHRRPVTLLAAPPGSGKTTLLAAWAERRRGDGPLWLTARRHHNEPGRLARKLYAVLTGDDPPASGRRRDGTWLLDLAFAAAADGPQQIIVLDDVQELSSIEALQVLGHLLQHAPEAMHVVVSTRADSVVRTARLRLEGRLGEIRTVDLQFTLAEAMALFEAYGLGVRRQYVGALVRHTEGWAAALALVASALKDGADPRRFAFDSAAADAVVADYFISEVLDQLDPDARDFLLHTSIVDRLNADLAQVLHPRDAPGQLVAAERDGLFLVALEDGVSYRYHSLVSSLLRARMRRDDPTLLRTLHRTASEWFEQHAMDQEAEEHARAGEDWPHLGTIVGRRWLKALRAGEELTTIDVSAVPDDLVRSTPALAAVGMGVASVRGDLEEAARFATALDRYEEEPTTLREGELPKTTAA